MRNTWLVLRYEYLRMAAKRSFLISTLALPLVFGLIVALSIVTGEGAGGDARPIGYVDAAGLLPDAAPGGTGGDNLALIRYATAPEGEAAVRAGTVQALFVLPADYVARPQVDVTVLDQSPSDRAWSRWNAFVRDGLLAAYPAALVERVAGGVDVIVRDVGGSREIDQGNVSGIVIPVIAAILFMIGAAMSSGYLLQAVVSEKENRTIEIMATSVTPAQLIGGKTIGLMCVSLAQMAIWLVTGAAAAAIYVALAANPPEIHIPWGQLAVMLAYLLPSYGLIAAVMVAIGGIVDDARRAEALSGPLMMPFMLPMALIPVMITTPTGPLITAMTLFPTTAFLTISMRSAFSVVPMWQMVVAWVLLVATAGVAMWLASRIFRLGMLLYGQRLTIRQIVADLRSAPRERQEAGQ